MEKKFKEILEISMKLDVKSQNPFLEFVKSAVVEVNLLAATLLTVYHLRQCAIKDKNIIDQK